MPQALQASHGRGDGMTILFFHCFACKKVAPARTDGEKKCAFCDSGDGEVVTPVRLKEGMEAGVFYNIDPKTGKRAKTKKR